MEPFMDNFGTFLKHLREEHAGITIDQLADACEMSEARLKSIEDDNVPAYHHEIYKLAQALEISASELLGDPNGSFIEIADMNDVENRTAFSAMIWLPHNLAPNSLETISKYGSPLPKKKSILYEVELRHVATTQEIENAYQAHDSIHKRMAEEELPENLLED